jgi:3-mercaptopyruvate sulfurtransferase SseA
MRNYLICSFAGIAAALLLACNSHEGAVGKLSGLGGSKSPTPAGQQVPVHNPADDARRITAEELYQMYEKHEVLIVDTRNDAAFKQSHIKGAILIPSNEVAARVAEFPKDKFIATYCT